MNNTLNNNPNDFRNWKDAVNNIYGVLHNLGGGATQNVNDNLVVEGTSNSTTAIAIYGINVIETSTAVDRACKLPEAKTGRSTTFVNNSSLPILIFPSALGGSINNVINGVATIPNDGKAYTFYCYENPLPGAWTWSPPATTQYDSGEIVCDTIAGAGVGRYNVAISSNYAKESDGAGSASTFWVFDCQNRDLIGEDAPDFLPHSLGDTHGVSGTALSADIMNITKIKVYTNAYVPGGSPMYCGMALGCGFSVYDSDQPGGTFITNGASTATSGPNSNSSTWETVPGATLPTNTLAPNIGDPGTQYISIDVPSWALIANYINLGPAQYIGPDTTPGQFIWYAGGWQFFIQSQNDFTDFKYRFIFEYN
tara:strand:+ start:9356 stop:10456 length:1101 start_codon:yes stop_codon:yes gene_type:complete